MSHLTTEQLPLQLLLILHGISSFKLFLALNL